MSLVKRVQGYKKLKEIDRNLRRRDSYLPYYLEDLEEEVMQFLGSSHYKPIWENKDEIFYSDGRNILIKSQSNFKYLFLENPENKEPKKILNEWFGIYGGKHWYTDVYESIKRLGVFLGTIGSYMFSFSFGALSLLCDDKIYQKYNDSLLWSSIILFSIGLGGTFYMNGKEKEEDEFREKHKFAYNKNALVKLVESEQNK